MRTLYYEAGEFLHRGALNFVLPATIRKVRLDVIQEGVAKIRNLLHNHRIYLIGGERELWIDMQGPEGFAALYAMRRTPPPPQERGYDRGWREHCEHLSL